MVGKGLTGWQHCIYRYQYQKQNEGIAIGVCTAVYGNAVAEGIGVCTAVYGNAVAEGIGVCMGMLWLKA